MRWWQSLERKKKNNDITHYQNDKTSIDMLRWKKPLPMSYKVKHLNVLNKLALK